MTHRTFDVGILGGGPAASLTATRLARMGLAVVVLSRRSQQKNFVEHLPPVALQKLSLLGLADCLHQATIAKSPGVVSRWGSTERLWTDYLPQLPGHGCHIHRGTFDAALLASAASDGAEALCDLELVDVRAASRCSPHVGSDVTVQSPSKRFTVRCSNLIDATGRRRWLARRFGRKVVATDKLVAIRCRSRVSNASSSWLRVDSHPCGWAYSCPTADGRRAVVLLTDPATLRQNKLVGQANASPTTQKMDPEIAPLTGALAKWRVQRQHRIATATTDKLDSCAAPGWLAVGDAAIRLDPLTGVGVLWACESSERAAMAMKSGYIGAFEVSEYNSFVNKTWLAYRQQRCEFYLAEKRWLAHGFWQRRRAWCAAQSLNI